MATFETQMVEVHRRGMLILNMREGDDGVWYVTLAKGQTQPASHWVSGIANGCVEAIQKALDIVDRRSSPARKRRDVEDLV